MKLGYKISITIITILLVVVTSIGRSYALWTITEKQSDTNLVESGCLNITYNDLTEDGNASSINLNNAYPISDEIGRQLLPYKVTINNTCTIAANYNIYLSSLQDNTLEEEYLKIYFTRINDNTTWGPQLLSDLTITNVDNSLKNTIETEKNIQIKNSYILASGVLNPTESKTYELRMWVSKEASNETMGKIFKSTVYMYSSATENHL